MILLAKRIACEALALQVVRMTYEAYSQAFLMLYALSVNPRLNRPVTHRCHARGLWVPEHGRTAGKFEGRLRVPHLLGFIHFLIVSSITQMN